MAEEVPHPRLNPDQLGRVILDLIGALPTPELRMQAFLHCLSQSAAGADRNASHRGSILQAITGKRG
jgi:hypothetical protein